MTEEQNQKPQSTESSEDESYIIGYAALENWKTSFGLAAIGLIARPLVPLMLGFAIASLSIVSILIWFMALCILLSIAPAIYALVFFRSYFTSKPRLTSSKAISFLNMLFGGIIFGSLWNLDMSKSRKWQCPSRGISYIVLTVSCGIALIGTVISMGPVVANLSNIPFNYSASLGNSAGSDNEILKDASNPAVSTQGNRVTDSTAGIAFDIPEGWHARDLSKERDYVRWKALPDDDVPISIIYGAAYVSQREWDEMTASDLEGFEYLDNYADEKVSTARIGDKECWFVTGTGTVKVSGNDAPIACVQVITHNGDTAYTFMYFDFTFGNGTDKYYKDFISLIGNATYS